MFRFTILRFTLSLSFLAVTLAVSACSHQTSEQVYYTETAIIGGGAWSQAAVQDIPNAVVVGRDASSVAEIAAYPSKYQSAVRAVDAGLVDSRRDPKEFKGFAWAVRDGKVCVYLKHKSHPQEWHSRGDVCGKCLIAVFDARTEKVTLIAIR